MHTTRYFRKFKRDSQKRPLSMLTCYDFQTASMLNQTDLDLILVGDSLGNVVLGYETTVQVSVAEMIIFAKAVRRGAPNKFVICDMPFGSYAYKEKAIESALLLFQETGANALKLEGANPHHLEIVEALVANGIPVVGHIGLLPQSVHEQGGYYVHGKEASAQEALIHQAQQLQAAGCFMLVLECIEKKTSALITQKLTIPTIGIGSGHEVDGQVLVINDLLKMGPTTPPKFCNPVANLFETKKNLIEAYLNGLE